MARLKNQIDWLAGFFAQPEEFQRELRQFFESYADWTYRPGLDIYDSIQMPAFHAPPLVMRQLDLSFGALGRSDPGSALAVVDRLWPELYLEARLFSAGLLGSVPASHQNEVLNRLESWCRPENERILNRSLLTDGGRQVRRDAPDRWLELAEKWLTQTSPAAQALGLRALLPLVEEPAFENLPAIFALAGPLLEGSVARLQNDLLNLLQALARRSPSETAFYLRQVVSISDDPLVARLARRCLPLLSPAGQSSLRSALTGRR
ncbi:MAG TPA: DNA alkylation repair protein [Anaerolineaceae bacterium]|nr:DNA alkylation repair protein [Anaerolineaceae bacterium]